VLEGEGFDMQTRVRTFLNRYVDFNFDIDTTTWEVSFSREVIQSNTTQRIENIKISRGEENIFIWSFFLAIVELAIDNDEAYQWVKYIYIDDPISSLDDNNVIIVASHLAQLLKDAEGKQFIISTHHGLFYNVMFNELKKAEKYLLRKDSTNNNYQLETLTKDTPFYQHIAILKELHEIALNGKIYTYHFNLLRNILEKTAAFHGFDKFSDCIKLEQDDADKIIHARRINILSHGNYSIFEPIEMQDENKEHFKKILESFIETYQFNDELFPEQTAQEGQA
jgi:wobble nucleotide-excising tRNase